MRYPNGKFWVSTKEIQDKNSPLNYVWGPQILPSWSMDFMFLKRMLETGLHAALVCQAYLSEKSVHESSTTISLTFQLFGLLVSWISIFYNIAQRVFSNHQGRLPDLQTQSFGHHQCFLIFTITIGEIRR